MSDHRTERIAKFQGSMKPAGVRFQVPFECEVVGAYVNDRYIPLDSCVVSPGDSAELQVESVSGEQWL